MFPDKKQIWIHKNWFDSIFILSPPFICLSLIFLFPTLFQTTNYENLWHWFILVLCIDVGHVYSTIYRTYFDKNIITTHKTFFILSPLLIYITGVILHSIDSILFWRAMAYLAVFHFVRQQYGFMRLYSRNEPESIFKKIDTITIYSATLFPLLYWHFSGIQNFNWFVKNDFIYLNNPSFIPILYVIYLSVLLIYVIKEIIIVIKYGWFNLPKNLLIIGTIVSWYFGIVYFKGDLTFTLLNVVSHGIPYYALVWSHGNKKTKQSVTSTPNWLSTIFKPKNIILFIGILIVFAYVEELLWDGFIWKEHESLFPTSNMLPHFTNNTSLMSFLVPLLALPQLLHYFIDGFIWKIKNDKFNWVQFFQ